jgi:hypothetical protein
VRVAAIPKRLIQTGRQRNLSLKDRAFTTNARLLNPDFEWRYFDDADVQAFVKQEFPQYLDTFESFQVPIQRYDFFRYLAVYRLGGFYMDLDVLLASPLTSLLPLECVLPFEGLTFSRLLRGYGMDWEAGNYAFGARPGDPFLGAVIENCVRSQRDRQWVEAMMPGVPPLSRRDHYVLYSTGPGVVSRTLAERPQLASGVTVLFPDDVCDPASWHTFGTFGVHLMSGSWRSGEGWLRRRLAQRWEAVIAARNLRVSRQLGRTRRVALDFASAGELVV